VAVAAQPGSGRGRRREGGVHTWWARGRARRNGGGDRRRSGGELGGGGGENGQPDGVDLKLGGASDLENFRGWTRPLYARHFYRRLALTTACRNRFYRQWSMQPPVEGGWH